MQLMFKLSYFNVVNICPFKVMDLSKIIYVNNSILKK